MTSKTIATTCSIATLLALFASLQACSTAPDGGNLTTTSHSAWGDDDDDGDDGDDGDDENTDDEGNAATDPPVTPPTDGTGCRAWQVGTMTGYDNSDVSDDPNAGSVVEYSGLTQEFYANVPIASIDSSDWGADKYHWVEIRYNGRVGRVQVWDMCQNADCPDGRDCCTENKQMFAQPGYLLDIETRTASRLFGIESAQTSLTAKIDYRVCDAFDPDAVAAQYGATKE